MRLKLTAADFCALVKGEEVVKTEDGKEVRLILEDIGFTNMRQAVETAQSIEALKTDDQQWY